MVLSRYNQRLESCLTLFVPRSDDLSRRPPTFRPTPVDPTRRPRLARSPGSLADTASFASTRSLAHPGKNSQLPNLSSSPDLPRRRDSMPPADEFDTQFNFKLSQCRQRCHFPIEAGDPVATRKANFLNEILRYVEVGDQARHLSAPLATGLCEMARANLERPLSLVDPRVLLTEDLVTFPDPEWVHVSIVYQIVTRFVEAVPHSPLINLAFIKMIFKQIGSRDEREHTAIHKIATQYAQRARPRELHDFFLALAAELTSWENSPNFMFAANATLWIATGFVHDLPGCSVMMAPLIERCLQLLTAPTFYFFRNIFLNFTMVVSQTDGNYALQILTAAMRHWPTTISAKQQCFLRLISVCFSKLSSRDVAVISPRLFQIIARAVCSSSARVAEPALRFLVDRAFEPFMVTNLQLLFPAVHVSMTETAASHWNAEIRELAQSTAQTFAQIDRRVYEELAARPDGDADRNRLLAWVRVLDAAAPAWADVQRTLLEIKSACAVVARPRAEPLPAPRMKRRKSADLRRQLRAPDGGGSLSPLKWASDA
jgi:hypothetical protein